MYKELWSELQVTVKTTNYTIDLKEVTRSIRYQPYCSGQRSWAVLRDHKYKQLESVVIGRLQSERGSTIVHDAKKDGNLRFLPTTSASRPLLYQTPVRCHVRIIVLPDIYPLARRGDWIDSELHESGDFF